MCAFMCRGGFSLFFTSMGLILIGLGFQKTKFTTCTICA